MDWWKEKFSLPKGYVVQERLVENEKTKFVIAQNKMENKWIGFDVVDGKLEKYKIGKSPIEVRRK